MEVVDIGHTAYPANREHIFVFSVYGTFKNTDYRLGYRENISKLQERKTNHNEIF